MDFYTAEEAGRAFPLCVHWEEMRPFVFQAIKGNKLPKSIKLVFSLAEEKLANLPNTKAAFLNILFKGAYHPLHHRHFAGSLFSG